MKSFILFLLFATIILADITKTEKYKAMDMACKKVGLTPTMKQISENINTMIYRSGNNGIIQIDAATYMLSAAYLKFNTDTLLIYMGVDIDKAAKIMNQNITIQSVKSKEWKNVFHEDNANIASSTPEQRVLLENGALIRNEYYSLDGEFLLRTIVSKKDCKKK